MSDRTVPTASEITSVKTIINARLHTLNAHQNRRIGAYPYYRFHEAGTPIWGTVLLFHSLGAKPHQMWRLADYLFRCGFNIYQPCLAGHALIPPDRYWPIAQLKPEIYHSVREGVQQDPVFQNYIANLAVQGDRFIGPSEPEQKALLSRLLTIAPCLAEIAFILERDNDPDFDRYFTSSHLTYLTDAQIRLAELDAMPGPLYAVGLSTGATVALAIAADRPDRIRRVVAYAPLLRIYGQVRQRYLNLAGPLEIEEAAYDPGLRYPIGTLTAVDRFGHFVLGTQTQSHLRKVPTFFVLTENDTVADRQTTQAFYQTVGGTWKGHQFYQYPTRTLVPHLLVNQQEGNGALSNRYFRTLYQETLRFLTSGEIDPDNLSNFEEDSKLPLVPLQN